MNKWGDTRPDVPLRQRVRNGTWVGVVCSVDECDREAFGHGLCAMHLERKRRTGSEHTATRDYSRYRPAIKRSGACSITGCGKAAFTQGLCTKHYSRLWKYGDPLSAGPVQDVVCATCDHPEVDVIDAALNGGASRRSVSLAYGVSEGSLRRHQAHPPDWHAKRAAFWVARLAEVRAATT